MSPRLLSANFIDEFRKQIDGAQTVRVASAWMTPNRALDALLRWGKQNCEVQAIIGTHGCATAPESLEALVEEFGFKSLRIADTTRLFHPKLFLFHRRDVVPVAWIGSANFTYGGLAGNMELILELDDRHAVSAMLDWFNGWWMELKDQDSKKALKEYKKRWKRESKKRNKRGDALEELVQGVGSRESPVQVATIQFRPKGRFKYANLTGEIFYGAGDSQQYESAADGLRKLLRRLSRGREDAFLVKCASEPAFQTAGKPFIADGHAEADARGRVYGRKGQTISHLLDTEERSWWISEDSTNSDKWNMVNTSIDVANEMSVESRLRLADRSLKSWPDNLIDPR